MRRHDYGTKKPPFITERNLNVALKPLPMSHARALTILVDNGVATIVVAKWTGDLDSAKLTARLNNKDWVVAQEPEVLLNAVDAPMDTSGGRVTAPAGYAGSRSELTTDDRLFAQGRDNDAPMAQLNLLLRIRSTSRRWYALVRGDSWFPHVPLALAMAYGGFLLLQLNFAQAWRGYVEALTHGHFNLPPAELPPLLIGGGMLIMAGGLLARSRLAWSMALLLALTGAASLVFGRHASGHLLLAYFVLMSSALFVAWRQFDRSSVAASTLFAVTSVIMLLMYATFGAYYLGQDFKPAISDLVTALYYALVTMSTVGYGDITPQTAQAKLFTISIIILGVAVFATSLTAVIAPMVSNSLQRIVNRKGSRMKRENHFVVIGNGSLAINTARELKRRGHPVTRLLRKTPDEMDPRDSDGDMVVGDPSSTEVLRDAGAHKAESVLAMTVDDSENAFVILAVKELGGKARTVAAVNDAANLSRVKLAQPDVVFSPQVLGGELIAMVLSGEEVTADFVMKHVFRRDGDPTALAKA
jgi:voltage-gated potassium channel